VIAQETGFTSFLPTGKGLFSFETTADVASAMEQVAADYRGHARSARALAEEYVDSDRVLGALLDQVGGAA
jgi:hypothetical protein